jgi:hypothetical protein
MANFQNSSCSIYRYNLYLPSANGAVAAKLVACCYQIFFICWAVQRRTTDLFYLWNAFVWIDSRAIVICEVSYIAEFFDKVCRSFVVGFQDFWRHLQFKCWSVAYVLSLSPEHKDNSRYTIKFVFIWWLDDHYYNQLAFSFYVYMHIQYLSLQILTFSLLISVSRIIIE